MRCSRPTRARCTSSPSGASAAPAAPPRRSPSARSISTGAAVWHTLISAPASYKNLPRQSFGNLQAVLLPSVFGVQAAAAGGLLVSFLREYPIVYHRFDLLDVHCWQAVTLLTTTGLSLFNLLVATPTCSKLMSDRHRQERAEGKDYSDPSVRRCRAASACIAPLLTSSLCRPRRR